MYQRVSVIGAGITKVKQVCQSLSLAVPLFFFFGHEPPLVVNPTTLTVVMIRIFYHLKNAKSIVLTALR